MSRTLDATAEPGRDGGGRRRKVLQIGASVAAAAVLLGTFALIATIATIRLSVRLATTEPVDAVAYSEAVALEAGVRPLVTDRAAELGTITRVEVRRTADPVPARIHLLAPLGEDRPRLSVMADPEPADLTTDGLLADGRPYAVYTPEGPYVSLATVGADGQYVEVMGRDMTFDELLVLAGDITVSHASLDRMPDGWTELGAAPMPPWHDGFDTIYEFLGGRRLGITVERASAGRAALAAFAPTDPVDLGTGGWAYRSRPPSSGLLFERGDVVVHLTGDFSEAEFLIVAFSLRMMRPEEHPIGAAPDGPHDAS